MTTQTRFDQIHSQYELEVTRLIDRTVDAVHANDSVREAARTVATRTARVLDACDAFAGLNDLGELQSAGPSLDVAIAKREFVARELRRDLVGFRRLAGDEQTQVVVTRLGEMFQTAMLDVLWASIAR